MTPDDHAKLLKVAALLASDSDGERASAAARATDILKRNGLTWEEALASIPVLSPFQSELVIVEPMLMLMLMGDEMSRLRAELATSEALREALLTELETAKPNSRDLF